MLEHVLKTNRKGHIAAIDDALELLDEVNQKLKKVAAGAGDIALDTAKDVTNRAWVTSKQTARKIDKSAHENAWKFVGMASAFSVLAGYYLGRCARD